MPVYIQPGGATQVVLMVFQNISKYVREARNTNNRLSIWCF